MEGELFKCTSYVSRWEKVYCVFDQNHLHFHSSQKDHKSGIKPIDSVDLRGCKFCEDSFSSDEFALVLNNLAQVRLKSPEAQAWVNAIQNVTETKKKTAADSSESRSAEKFENLKGESLQHKTTHEDSRKSKTIQVYGKFSLRPNDAKKTKLQQENDDNEVGQMCENQKVEAAAAVGGDSGSRSEISHPGCSNRLREERRPAAKTFYTSLSHTFAEVRSTIILPRKKRGGPPHVSYIGFIRACSQCSLIFDRMQSAVLIPVKVEFQNDINRLKMKKRQNRFQADSLLGEVQYEIDENKTQSMEAVAQILIWVIRALKCINIFTLHVMDERSPTFKNVSNSLVVAYETVLLKHHNWFAQKMFKAGIKLITSYETMVEVMVEPQLQHLPLEERENLIFKEGLYYAKDLAYVLDVLVSYFASVGLEI